MLFAGVLIGPVQYGLSVSRASLQLPPDLPSFFSVVTRRLHEHGPVGPSGALRRPQPEALRRSCSRRGSPEAYAEATALDRALQAVTANRGRAARTVAKIAGVPPDSIGIFDG